VKSRWTTSESHTTPKTISCFFSRGPPVFCKWERKEWEDWKKVGQGIISLFAFPLLNWNYRYSWETRKSVKNSRSPVTSESFSCRAAGPRPWHGQQVSRAAPMVVPAHTHAGKRLPLREREASATSPETGKKYWKIWSEKRKIGWEMR